jgi:hypothetical protein
MGLADNAARAAGEKVVVKPTTAATTSASSPTVTAANKGTSEPFKATTNFVLGENIAGAMRGENSWKAVTGKDVALAAATFIPGGLGLAAKSAGAAAKATPFIAKAVTPAATTAAKTATTAASTAPKLGGAALSVAQSGAAAVSRPTLSAAAGLSNMAADVKNAANFIKNSPVAKNTLAFTGTLAAGSAALGVKDMITSSSAAPTTRPTTTGGTAPAQTTIDAGRVSTPANAVPRPTTTGGSTSTPSTISGTSLPADTVVKPTVTGTPANVTTGSTTADGARVGSGDVVVPGTVAGAGAGAAAGAGAGSFPGVGNPSIPNTNTDTGVNASTNTGTRVDAKTESVATEATLRSTPPRIFPRPRLPRIGLPEVNGSPVEQGAVQSDWQDFRGTSSVVAKESVQGSAQAATYSVSGGKEKPATTPKSESKDEGKPDSKGTRPSASSWLYKNPND